MSEHPLNPFEDDPILGAFVAYYPANRLRLLIIGSGFMLVVWFVVTVSLWNVPDDTASILTLFIITLAALILGWWALHLWNREFVLYTHGFSYRRGSHVAYIHYQHVVTVRQSGALLTYLGGLIRRATFRLTLITDVAEIILVDATYARSDTLMRQIEAAIMQSAYPRAVDTLTQGGQLDFEGELSLSADGVHYAGDTLHWAAIGDVTVAGDVLKFRTMDGDLWRQVSIMQLANVPLLLRLLRERVPQAGGKTS